MATSDSEDFESADENLEEVNSKKGRPVKGTPPSDSGGKNVEGLKKATLDEDKVFDMFDDKRSPAVEKEQRSESLPVKDSRQKTKKEERDGTGGRVKQLGKKPVDSTNRSETGTATIDSRLRSEPGDTVDLLSYGNDTRIPKTETKAEDGWDLEDGFEIPTNVDDLFKPKHEEFEKELFPVLNKLSSLSTADKDVKREASTAATRDAGKQQQAEDCSAPPSADGGGWGGWAAGVGSLLSTATSTLTGHVSAGINTVLETGLGAPDPRLLAEAAAATATPTKEEEKEAELKDGWLPGEGVEEEEDRRGGGLSGFGQLFSGVSVVGQLGTRVISGGLDTLETLGKKTMEVLQDGDPGLRKKRAIFFQNDGSQDRPILSQILREAKENADQSNKLEAEKQATKKVHLETLFDDYQGLVHLEALEMLSSQCQLKLQSILLAVTGNALKDLQETLDQVKELCELPDEEEEDDEEGGGGGGSDSFERRMSEAVVMLGVDVPRSKILEVSKSVESWLKSEESRHVIPVAIHQKAVASMAEFTSVSMETFHRAAELLLIKPHHSSADEAESLTRLTTVLCAHVSRMATKFTTLATENGPNENNELMIKTIFMESAECSSYIQDACHLMVPILQLGATS